MIPLGDILTLRARLQGTRQVGFSGEHGTSDQSLITLSLVK